MRKTKICQSCNKEFNTYQKINGKWFRFIKKKNCPECSPIHSYTLSLKKEDENTRLCRLCAKLLPIENFCNNNKSGQKNSYCNKCHSQKVRTSRQNFKIQCIEYLGGKCVKCGYNNCADAFDFHHRDPKQKDFGIGKHQGTKFSEKVKLELDKCDLVCANCHREIHNKIYLENFFSEINQFG